MIKFNTDNGKCSMEIRGSLNTLMADTGLFIRNMYKSIKEENEDAADIYKEFICDSKYISRLIFDTDFEDDSEDKKSDDDSVDNSDDKSVDDFEDELIKILESKIDQLKQLRKLMEKFNED